jgi:signal transduction histidine kinase
MADANVVVRRRKLVYLGAFLILAYSYYLLRDSTWLGGIELHTIMETAATLLALNIGILALVHYYSKKDNTFLFVGTGFVATGFLDGYHALVTASFFTANFPSTPPHLVPWSWLASRLFLSVLLWLSWVFWKREVRLGETGKVSERWVYAIVGVLALACFISFAFIPLPRAYYPDLAFPRPQEFVPAAFFFFALIGYLRKGRWRSDPFEHWLVLSLIVGFMGEAMFMSESGKLYDAMFDTAHVLKKLSYICALTGLLISMYVLFKRSEENNETILRLNEELEAKVVERTKQLLETQEELVRKEKLSTLGQIAGSVGHELRNPLGVINNAVYFLQTVLSEADPTTREYLNIIKDEILNADRIVGDLLDSVRIKPPQPQNVAIGTLIEQVLRRIAVPDGINVTLDIPAAQPPIRVDPIQVQQVFRNLITNGFDAMPQGGNLDISAVDDATLHVLSVKVKDSGIGIAPENMAKLFQPLFTTKARGIGLGLVVVKNLTQSNGGTVTVESVPGKGSTFTVTLPAAESA